MTLLAGTLSGGGRSGVASVAVATDALGQAAAPWVLGSRAGAGNNLVEASAVGFAGQALFSASGLAAAAAELHLDAGNNQTGAAGQPLTLPFVAVVTDAGHNRLAAVPVTFTVVSGDGSFNGLSAVTVDSDASGRAVVLLTLGPGEGFDNNEVEAAFAGLVGLPVTFVATGKVPGDPAATRVSGVVLDNSDIPVPGVTLSIEGTALSAQSDAQGQFTIANVAPGPLTLLADGTTATRPGTWPALEFELTAVAGRDNRLERPVYLLPLETQNLLCVDATTGGTLTLPEVPGFALTVEAGAATFPDGTQAGCVGVTPVHADKVPMTPNFGQQPRFIVTIQPAGVLFDPPAPLSLPNADGLAPGAVTELYSFDHDLGQFVSIGTATVTPDGTTVASDPGVGIVKSGWASGGDPDSTGDAENVFVSFSPPPVIFLSGGPVPISAAGGPSPGSFSWSSNNSSVLSLGVSSSSSVTATPVAPGTAQVSVIYTAQSGKSSPTATATVTVAEITIPDTIAVCKDQTREIPVTLNPSPLPSGATVELSLNTVAGTGAATFDDGSTSLSLTQSTTVIVKGASPSETMDDIELIATSASKEIAKDNLSVIFVTNLTFRGDGPISDNNSQKADLTAAGLTTLGLIDDNSLIIGALVEVTADVKPSNFNKPIRLARKKTRIAYQINPGGSVFFDETPPDTDDTGATPADAIRDDDPQPDGKIYDVDIPGFERIDLAEIDLDETIMSRRANFRQFAEYQEPGQTVFQKCSEVSQDFDLRWFDRQSIELTDATTNTWVRENSVPTDNEVGEPTTSLKIDLSN